MRVTTRGLSILCCLLLFACGDDGGGGGGNPDAGVNTPDADPNAPDADPNAPDADPNAPDADPSAPDAMEGCANGLDMCGGACVDLDSDPDHCGTCPNSCSSGQTCVLGNCVSGVGSLVLSEVHAQEPAYFELYNGGSASIDLTDYQIQWLVDGLDSGAFVLPAYDLAAGEFVILREGSGTDGAGLIYVGDDVDWTTHIGVRLLDPSGIGVDFVRTGASTVTPGTGDSWTGGNPDNPSATVDQSLVRNVYTPDTDASADWSMRGRGSPGNFCPTPGRCGDACYDFSSDRDNCGDCGVQCLSSQVCIDGSCRAGYTGLWISEYRRYPRPGVEIHNPTTSAINVENYRVEISGPTNLSFTVPALTLEPGQFVFVYMGDGVPDGLSVYTGPSGAFGYDIAIALYDDGNTALDFVKIGGSTAPAPSGTAWFGANVTAPVMGADVSIKRNIETFDTDGAADWVGSSPSTPGFACYPGLSICDGACFATAVDDAHCGDCGTSCGAHERCNGGTCTSSGGVVIAELRNYSTEYIELFNGSDSAVDLSSWAIQWTADGGSGNYTIGALTIDPGQSIVFYESSGSDNANSVFMASPINWTDAIAVTLRDDGDNPVDFVRTGTSVVAPPSGTTWTGANPDNPSSGSSTMGALTRAVFAADTDSAADWTVGDDSPGRLCPSTQDSVCGSSCVNLDTSAANCGACGNVCGNGASCYQGECVEVGALRLSVVSGTDGISSGRVEMFQSNRWNAVGYDGTWGNTDATVACKQLGFSSGTGNTSSYGNCSGCGTVYNFQCTGDEPRLYDCPHSITSTSYSGYRGFCSE
jgi:hypothetical protein